MRLRPTEAGSPRHAADARALGFRHRAVCDSGCVVCRASPARLAVLSRVRRQDVVRSRAGGLIEVHAAAGPVLSESLGRYAAHWVGLPF